MTREARRLADLATQMNEQPAQKPKAAGIEANPPHGEKGDFVKVTITLPPEVYTLIATEATRRKAAKEKGAQISAIIREAVVAVLDR